MKNQTEMTLRSILALDASVAKTDVERAMALLRGNPTNEDDLVHVMRYSEAMDRLGVSRKTISYYVRRGQLKRVFGCGRQRALGISWESYHRFTRLREEPVMTREQKPSTHD